MQRVAPAGRKTSKSASARNASGNYRFVKNLLPSLSVKQFWKSVPFGKVWRKKIEWHLFADTVYRNGNRGYRHHLTNSLRRIFPQCYWRVGVTDSCIHWNTQAYTSSRRGTTSTLFAFGDACRPVPIAIDKRSDMLSRWRRLANKLTAALWTYLDCQLQRLVPRFPTQFGYVESWELQTLSRGKFRWPLVGISEKTCQQWPTSRSLGSAFLQRKKKQELIIQEIR